MLHRLFPDPARIDDPSVLDDDLRAERPHDDRPWLLANMVTSVDGGISLDGTSGALGRSGDRMMFPAVRSLADVILVAAETVRAEDYNPPGADESIRARRRSHGVAEVARVAIVTRSARLDPEARIFGEGPSRPIVLTTSSADPGRRRALAEVADVEVVGDDGVAPADALGALARIGATVVLSEGGPSWNGQLVAADLVDELFVTVAPTVVGGDTSRLAHGPGEPTAHDLELSRLWISEDGEVLLRYHRRR